MQNKETNTVKAFLNQDIDYKKDGTKVIVKKDTEILVDLFRGVAFISGDHVDIYPEEYKVVSL